MNWEKKPWRFIATGNEYSEMRMYLIHSLKILTGVLNEKTILESLDETDPMILICKETNQAIMSPDERAILFQETLKIVGEVSH